MADAGTLRAVALAVTKVVDMLPPSPQKDVLWHVAREINVQADEADRQAKQETGVAAPV